MNLLKMKNLNKNKAFLSIFFSKVPFRKALFLSRIISKLTKFYSIIINIFDIFKKTKNKIK